MRADILVSSVSQSGLLEREGRVGQKGPHLILHYGHSQLPRRLLPLLARPQLWAKHLCRPARGRNEVAAAALSWWKGPGTGLRATS